MMPKLAQIIGEAIPTGSHYVALRIEPECTEKYLDMVARRLDESGNDIVELNLISEEGQAILIGFRRSEWH